jgi:hypothetical protein
MANLNALPYFGARLGVPPKSRNPKFEIRIQNESEIRIKKGSQKSYDQRDLHRD